MSAVTGDDQEWQLSGYGVLGTGTPRTFVDQDNNTRNLDGYGVWGLLGTPDLNSEMIDEVTSNYPNQQLLGAVVGRNALDDTGAAVYGECRPPFGLAVSSGFIAGRNPIGGEQTGLFGQGPRGVIGAGNGSDGFGIVGTSEGTGVLGYSGGSSGVGVHGINNAGGLAGQFDGDVTITGKLTGDITVERNVKVGGDLFLANGDIAERFPVTPSAPCEPGMVMSIGENGTLVPCHQQYDRRVVGVVSGAGSLAPAVTLRHTDSSGPNAVVALAGTVYCLVDAENIAIEVGDLLTASDTRGHAMKVTDPLQGFGAVIGKALAPLKKGRGLIPIIVALQ